MVIHIQQRLLFPKQNRLLAILKLSFVIGTLANVILAFTSKRAPTSKSTSTVPQLLQDKNDFTVTINAQSRSSSITIRRPYRADQHRPEWVTLVIVCGNGETDTVIEMQPLLTSALLLSSVPIHFVFVTEQVSANRIQTMFQDGLKDSKKPLKVDIWVLPEEPVKTFASILKFDLASHHSGIWGFSKLLLPWILQDIDRAIVIDTDMVFLDDPARLWDEFHPSPWLYKMPIHDKDDPSNICSCIVLLKMDLIRQSNTFPAIMEEALSAKPDWKMNGLYTVPHGDQGLFWAILLKNANYVSPLPAQWNADRCHNYFEVLNRDDRKPASVLHNNCAGPTLHNFGPAATFYEFFEKYKWHWLKGDEGTERHRVTTTIHLEETSRLQDLFNCLRERGNYTMCKS